MCYWIDTLSDLKEIALKPRIEYAGGRSIRRDFSWRPLAIAIALLFVLTTIVIVSATFWVTATATEHRGWGAWLSGEVAARRLEITVDGVTRHVERESLSRMEEQFRNINVSFTDPGPFRRGTAKIVLANGTELRTDIEVGSKGMRIDGPDYPVFAEYGWATEGE